MHLKPLEAADVQFAVSLYQESAAWTPYTIVDLPPEVALGRLTQADASFRIAMNGASPVGLMGFESIKWIDRVGEPLIAIASHLRGQGWGRQLASLMHMYAVDVLNLRRLQSVVLEDAPSRKLLEMCGFEVEGVMKKVRYRDGRYLNAVVYGWVRS